jgi:hypothetical protein
VGKSVVLKRSIEGDRSLKRHRVRSRVSNKDTRSSDSMVKENEV